LLERSILPLLGEVELVSTTEVGLRYLVKYI